MRKSHSVLFKSVESIINFEIPCIICTFTNQYGTVIFPGRENSRFSTGICGLDYPKNIPVMIIRCLIIIIPNIMLIRPGCGEQIHVSRSRDCRSFTIVTFFSAYKNSSITTYSRNIVQMRRIYLFDNISRNAIH